MAVSGKAKKEAGESSAVDDEEEDEAHWWSTGYDEMDRIPDSDNIRFRMDIRDMRYVLFIDGDGPEDVERWDVPFGAPVCLWEYEIPITGDDGKPKWGTTITSLKGRKTANGKPAKDHVRASEPTLSPYYVGFYTIADVTDLWDDYLDGYLDSEDSAEDDGKSKNKRRRRRRAKKDAEAQKKLLPAKKKFLKKLRDEGKAQSGLRGCVFEVYRSKKWAARIGDEWNFVERVSEEDIRLLIPESMDRPLDYKMLLAPKSKEEIDAILAIRAEPEDDDKRKSRGGRRGGRDDDDDDRGRGRGRKQRSRDDDDDDRRGRSSRQRDDEEDDDKPRSRGRRPSKDEDEDEDEPRSRRRGRREEADEEEDAPRSRGRRPRRDEEDEENEEDEKPRSRQSRRSNKKSDSEDDADDDVAAEDLISF